MTDRPKRIAYGDRFVEVDAADEAALIDVASDALGVRSSSRACANGQCGACRLLVDGAVITGCQTAWRDVPNGARVESYELVPRDPAVKRAVGAFLRERPTRCRMCVGALAITALDLSRRGAEHDEAAVDEALRGITCMCTGRVSLRRALLGEEDR
jgi:carbon-monoxide dehydrogenase small subunit